VREGGRVQMVAGTTTKRMLGGESNRKKARSGVRAGAGREGGRAGGRREGGREGGRAGGRAERHLVELRQEAAKHAAECEVALGVSVPARRIVGKGLARLVAVRPQADLGSSTVPLPQVWEGGREGGREGGWVGGREREGFRGEGGRGESSIGEK
jgi:hypothetical protein